MKFLRVVLLTAALIGCLGVGSMAGYVIGGYTTRHLLADLCREHGGFKFHSVRFVCVEVKEAHGSA